eukprot:scaffold44191_cov20-Tisochrysis_lutea.AAC.1
MERAAAMQHAQPAKGNNSPGSSGSPRSPVLPSAMLRKLPGESALAMRLLSTRPRQRPSASQVLAALTLLWGIEEVHATGSQLHEPPPPPALMHRRSLPAATPTNGHALPPVLHAPPEELPAVLPGIKPPCSPALPAIPPEKHGALPEVQPVAQPASLPVLPGALTGQPAVSPVVPEGGYHGTCTMGTRSVRQLVDVGIQTEGGVCGDVRPLQELQEKDKELHGLRERVAYLETLLQQARL